MHKWQRQPEVPTTKEPCERMKGKELWFVSVVNVGNLRMRHMIQSRTMSTGILALTQKELCQIGKGERKRERGNEAFAERGEICNCAAKGRQEAARLIRSHWQIKVKSVGWRLFLYPGWTNPLNMLVKIKITLCKHHRKQLLMEETKIGSDFLKKFLGE